MSIKILSGNTHQMVSVKELANGDQVIGYGDKEYELELAEQSDSSFGKLTKHTTDINGSAISVIQHAWNAEVFVWETGESVEGDTAVEALCNYLDMLEKESKREA